MIIIGPLKIEFKSINVVHTRNMYLYTQRKKEEAEEIYVHQMKNAKFTPFYNLNRAHLLHHSAHKIHA